MGSLFCFVFILKQLVTVLATHEIPLKCFLQKNNFLNVFAANTTPAPHNMIPTTIRSLTLGTVIDNSVRVDKDGWLYVASSIEYQGLDDAVVDEFGFNLSGNELKIIFHTDIISIGPYFTNGTLFSIPIAGEGVSEVVIRNIQYGLVMPFEIFEKDGTKFMKVKNFDYWYNIRDKAEFDLSNLYYGNEELSKSMHYLMNENWKYMTSNFGKVFLEKIAHYVYNEFRNTISDVPLNDFTTC